jgi:hypothetical protein
LANVVNSIAIAMHLVPQNAPAYIGTRVTEPKTGTANPKREDVHFGDIWIVDDPKTPYPTGWAGKVDDKSQPEQIAFPMGW